MKTLLLLFLPLFAQSQDFKITTKIDDFTGEKLIKTTPFSFGYYEGCRLDFSLYDANGAQYLLAQIISSREPSYIPAGSGLLIKLEDGSIISLETGTDVMSEVSGSYYYALTIHVLTDEDLIRLTKSPIAKVRLETSDKVIDFPPLGKKHPGEAMANFLEYYTFISK